MHILGIISFKNRPHLRCLYLKDGIRKSIGAQVNSGYGVSFSTSDIHLGALVPIGAVLRIHCARGGDNVECQIHPCFFDTRKPKVESPYISSYSIKSFTDSTIQQSRYRKIFENLYSHFVDGLCLWSINKSVYF